MRGQGGFVTVGASCYRCHVVPFQPSLLSSVVCDGIGRVSSRRGRHDDAAVGAARRQGAVPMFRGAVGCTTVIDYARSRVVPPAKMPSSGHGERRHEAAVDQDGIALRAATEDLRKEPEVMEAAVTQNGLALELAHGDLRRPRARVSCSEPVWACLKLWQEGLKKDPEFMKAAVTQVQSDARRSSTTPGHGWSRPPRCLLPGG